MERELGFVKSLENVLSKDLLHKHKVLNNIKIFENLDQANDCQSIIHVLERDAINSTGYIR